MNFKHIILMLFVLFLSISIVSANEIGDNATSINDESTIEIENAIYNAEDNNSEQSNILKDSLQSNEEEIIGEGNLEICSETGTINGVDYSNYFDTTNGYANTTDDLIFTGIFNAKTFGNFKINESITIYATEATFNNVGFDLLASNITLIGGTYNMDDSVATNTVINVTGDYTSVTETVIDVYAPEDQDFIAIDVANSTGTLIYDNYIYYECAYPNLDNTNYVIRVKNSPYVNITYNEITSVLPFKNVDYHMSIIGYMFRSISCILIEESDSFVLYFNFIEGYIENTCTGFPTLDMVIICDSDNGYVGWNSIDEIDFVTEPNDSSYLYLVNLYRCNNLTVEFNELYLESDGGTFFPDTISAGEAYGIKLTGPYTGVVIKNNAINTANNGHNAGIYSQNFAGYADITIINNTINVVGNASFHQWYFLSGIELMVDYSYIEGNAITVTNVGNYTTGHNVYGISFSQYYVRLPTSFVVVNNTVDLINGHYTVYIQDAISGLVIHNCLTSMDACGNATVYDNGHITIADNYCPQCNGVNCTCIH